MLNKLFRFSSLVAALAGVLLTPLGAGAAPSQQAAVVFADGFESWSGSVPIGWTGGGVQASANAHTGVSALQWSWDEAGISKRLSTPVGASTLTIRVWALGDGGTVLIKSSGDAEAECFIEPSSAWQQFACSAPFQIGAFGPNSFDMIFVGYGADAGLVLLIDDVEVAVETVTPTETPTDEPTETPTDEPTETPTDEPTETPTDEPTATSVPPTATNVPTVEPTNTPAATVEPTSPPPASPTTTATEVPSPTPFRQRYTVYLPYLATAPSDANARAARAGGSGLEQRGASDERAGPAGNGAAVARRPARAVAAWVAALSAGWPHPQIRRWAY